jgi:hypothetical protein
MNRLTAMGWFAGALALLAGCDDHDRRSERMSSETRDVGAFREIEMDGAARLEITVGGAESVSIEARESALRRIKTDVRGDTLHIKSKPKDWFISDGRPRVTIRITVPELESLKLEGGNDVRLAGFNGGETRIRAEGAAHIRAEGRLDELTVHLAGAGHADFTRLLADDAKVTVDGVGSVYVHPRESLNATMNGVGAILYVGEPGKVKTRMNGLGTIGQRKASELRGRERERRRDRRQDRDAPHEDPLEDIPPEHELIDPDLLQPEYDDTARERDDKPRTRLPVSDSTEVI